MRGWQEVYDGGSPEAERQIFLDLAEKMLEIQESNRIKAGKDHHDRTLHSKMVVGVAQASLIVDAEIPAPFRVLHFQPGAALPVAVRFSNASAIPQSDAMPDMRGAALKIMLDGGDVHDLLLTSFPVSHARNARQFVDFAMLAQGPRETFLPRLASRFGEAEAARMINNIQQAARPCASFALERFWSRGAILWDTMPVRFELRPMSTAASHETIDAGPDALRHEFTARLKSGSVSFRLAVQPFVDEASTPIEDAGIEWREDVSAPVEIATLNIPAQDLDEADAKARAAQIDAMAFNPWNAPAPFRPLGNLNRVRGVVYAASSQRWQQRGHSKG
ncbi:catalase [Paraburkholderia sp. BCC1885]|uniref:catalase n=1 Tax=Paraburkholderia sp. BCC1885 TaxID=2562669 RepID=UPI0016425A48|nr:catalase [Paraburkholderia sp. BCC1885]